MVEGYCADWFGFGCGGWPSSADYDGVAASTVECGCDDGGFGADAFELGDCCAVCVCVYVCAERASVDVACVFVTPFVVTPTGRVRARARVMPRSYVLLRCHACFAGPAHEAIDVRHRCRHANTFYFGAGRRLSSELIVAIRRGAPRAPRSFLN